MTWRLFEARFGDTGGASVLQNCSAYRQPLESISAEDSRLFEPETKVVTSGWLGSRVVSVLDSGAEGPGFKSQPRRCRVTVLGKLFIPIVPLLTEQQIW